MKLSTTSSPKPPDHRSILLLGPHGSGKTTFAMQFPHVWFGNCDNNLDGPERFLRKISKLDLNYSYDNIVCDDDGKAIHVSTCFDRLMDKLLAVKNEPSIEWVVVDSLTLIDEFIAQKIYKDKSVTEISLNLWSTFKSTCYNLIGGRLRVMNKNVIVIAHETSIERSDTKNPMQKVLIERRPYIRSGVNEQLGAFFTDMWRMTADPAPGGRVEYKLQTAKTQFDELKCSIGLPAEIINPTYEKIREYLEGKK